MSKQDTKQKEQAPSSVASINIAEKIDAHPKRKYIYLVLLVLPFLFIASAVGYVYSLGEDDGIGDAQTQEVEEIGDMADQKDETVEVEKKSGTDVTGEVEIIESDTDGKTDELPEEKRTVLFTYLPPLGETTMELSLEVEEDSLISKQSVAEGDKWPGIEVRTSDYILDIKPNYEGFTIEYGSQITEVYNEQYGYAYRYGPVDGKVNGYGGFYDERQSFAQDCPDILGDYTITAPCGVSGLFHSDEVAFLYIVKCEVLNNERRAEAFASCDDIVESIAVKELL